MVDHEVEFDDTGSTLHESQVDDTESEYGCYAYHGTAPMRIPLQYLLLPRMDAEQETPMDQSNTKSTQHARQEPSQNHSSWRSKRPARRGPKGRSSACNKELRRLVGWEDGADSFGHWSLDQVKKFTNPWQWLDRDRTFDVLKDWDHKYFAVPFTNSKKQREDLITIVDHPSVFQSIRHGGPWSTYEKEPDLMENTFVRYDQGWERRKQAGWIYNPETLCTVWLIYTKNPDLVTVGRGGFQVEDAVHPCRTEPFLALLGSKSHPYEGHIFQGQKLASSLFPAMLNVFNSWSAGARMRGLALPANEKSYLLLRGNCFKQAYGLDGEPKTVCAWRRSYMVYEQMHEDAEEFSASAF